MGTLRIRTNQAKPGMIAAHDVYTLNNQLIITKGTVLNERVITRLQFYNIFGLNVYLKPKAEEVQEESYIDTLRSSKEFKKFNRTYVETVHRVEDNFNGIIRGVEEINVDQ